MHRKSRQPLDRSLGFRVRATYQGLTQGNRTQKRLINKPDATLLVAASGKSLPAAVMLILISVPELVLRVYWLLPRILFFPGIKPGLFPSPSATLLALGWSPSKDNHLQAGGLLTLAPLCKHTDPMDSWRVLNVKSIDPTRALDSKFHEGLGAKHPPKLWPCRFCPWRQRLIMVR